MIAMTGNSVIDQNPSASYQNPAVEEERRALEAAALVALRQWIQANPIEQALDSAGLHTAARRLVEFEHRHGFIPEGTVW